MTHVFEVSIKLQNGNYKVYNSFTEQIVETEILNKNINSYYVPKHFITKLKDRKGWTNDEVNNHFDKVLKKYSKRLIIDRKELLNCDTLIKKFDIFDVYRYEDGNTFFRRGDNVVTAFFKMITKKNKYDYFDKITFQEYQYFESCFNGSLTYTETGIFNCYGYDYSKYYPSILGNIESKFKIPFKEGVEKTIVKLPKYLQYGFYKVKITSNNLKFDKLFKFNNRNIYCHYDVQFAREFDDVNVELILNEPNAFVYKGEDLIESNKIFNLWFETIKKLKDELPKNTLVKLLASSLWGYLSKSNIEIKTDNEFFSDDFDEDEYIIIDQVFKNNYSYFKLINKNKKFYSTNFRLKPFITSFARCKTARTIVDNNLIDNVIRIHTDSVCLSKPFDFSKYNNELIPEDKTTGKFEFININNYVRID